MSTELTREQARNIARILWTARQRQAREAEEQLSRDLTVDGDEQTRDDREAS